MWKITIECENNHTLTMASNVEDIAEAAEKAKATAEELGFAVKSVDVKPFGIIANRMRKVKK